MNAYRYVYEIYKEKSFSKAAANLYISQPALSATIRKIESQLGYQIFDRSTSALRLTEAGAAYVEAAEQILGIERDLERYVDDLTNLKSGHLVVSGTAFFSSYVLAPILRAFREQCPGIELEFIEADSLKLYEQAMKNHIDLIVDGGDYDREHFDSHLLFREHILLGIPAQNPVNERFARLELTGEAVRRGEHLEARTEGIDLGELKGEEFILLKRGHDLHRRAAELCGERGFSPKSAIHLNQLMTAVQIAAHGLGCVFLTDTLVARSWGSMPMKYYKLRTDRPELAVREVFIAHRKNCRMTRAMERFIAVGQSL